MMPPPLDTKGLTVCMDPGKHTFGVALFHGADLLAMDTKSVQSRSKPLAEQEQPWQVGVSAFQWVITGQMVCAPELPISRVFIEWPQVYEGEARNGKKDPNDLLWLAAAAHAFAAKFWFPPIHVLPRVWKGSVPKDVMTNRILKRLSANPREFELAVDLERRRKKAAHHALDAVGIGLWAAGRL